MVMWVCFRLKIESSHWGDRFTMACMPARGSQAILIITLRDERSDDRLVANKSSVERIDTRDHIGQQ